MKRRITAIFAGILTLLVLLCTEPLMAQNPELMQRYKLEMRKADPGIVCFASDRPNHFHVPPPAEFLRGGRTEQATFEVEYIGFPDVAREAFQRAVDIWATQIKSPVTIRIQANWQTLPANALGSARPGTFLRSPLFPTFPTWYPIALAEKILGFNVNGNEPDIVANFNADQTTWYFGTDGNPPSGRFDLTTVVLHEIGHGLGLTDSFGTNAAVTLGGWGDQDTPFIYDRFVENFDGRRLIDTAFVANPSGALLSQMQSNSLFYNGSATLLGNFGLRARLHAPNPYERGSSISHLDPNTYSSSENQLMLPAIAPGNATQNPGPVTMGMLADMGWVLTSINHQPLPNTDIADQPFTVRARLVSDTTSNFSDFSLTLFYRLNGSVTFQQVAMLFSGGEYSAQIPAPGREAVIDYYIEALSSSGRRLLSPSIAPQITWQFTVVDDREPPLIAHQPIAFVTPNTSALVISANITDQIGVDTAFVSYSINQGALLTQPLLRLGGNVFSSSISLPAGSIRDGDIIRYRITAIDRSVRRNEAQAPASGFFEVRVEGLQPARESYENNFNTPSNDFVGADFRIETPPGFLNPAIHSDHPYKDGTGPNNESNYTYQLKFPIKINANRSFIRFDEIALIEPGEPGTVFGQIPFWDYVIVEGSTDGGLTWRRAGNGYDAREHSEWLTTYNSNIVNGNSLAPGTPSLFKPRIINLLDWFAPGQEVVFRFRLFADESVFGWGWAIDNLQIQAEVVGLDDYLVSQDDIKVYPNPNQGNFMVSGIFKKVVNELSISVHDALGRRVYTHREMGGNQFQHPVSIDKLAAGIYFVNIEFDNLRITRKITVQ